MEFFGYTKLVQPVKWKCADINQSKADSAGNGDDYKGLYINCMSEGGHSWFHYMFFIVFFREIWPQTAQFRNNYSKQLQREVFLFPLVADVRLPGSFHLVFVCFSTNEVAVVRCWVPVIKDGL